MSASTQAAPPCCRCTPGGRGPQALSGSTAPRTKGMRAGIYRDPSTTQLPVPAGAARYRSGASAQAQRKREREGRGRLPLRGRGSAALVSRENAGGGGSGVGTSFTDGRRWRPSVADSDGPDCSTGPGRSAGAVRGGQTSIPAHPRRRGPRGLQPQRIQPTRSRVGVLAETQRDDRRSLHSGSMCSAAFLL